MIGVGRTTEPQRPLLAVRWLLLAGLLLLALVAGTARSEQATPPSTDQPVVVRIRAATLAESRELTGWGLDLLEMRDGENLFAIVSPQEHAALLAAGWQVSVDAEQTALLQQVRLQTFMEGYRTVEEIEQFLQQMAARYPALATLQDFGDSWERLQPGGAAGYNLWALRLTSNVSSGPKPVFFLMASIHAREIATPEVATRFIEYLLTHYGHDAEATWLLDEYEVVVVPVVNPDGYTFAEQGYYQRKNTNTSYGGNCTQPPDIGNHFGVDLNRNFEHAWGTIDSPDLSPCSVTFPGGLPASEPETQALQNFVRTLYPAGPRPGDGVAASDDTSGVLITLHSYSDLVLWPWGHTADPAPNQAALAQLGQRMAAFNGYTPWQAIGLYPTSGTTDDWSYAELGIASYTFEIGPSFGICGGFFPDYSCLDGGPGGNFWGRNLPALLYAARVSRAPYTQPAGPDLTVRSITIVSDTNRLSDTTLLSLTVALDSGGEPVSDTEVYIGASPWLSGTALALQPVDSVPLTDTPRWQAAFPADLLNTACTTDQHGAPITCLDADFPRPVLLIRGRSPAGSWGPLRPVWPPLPADVEAQDQRRVWLPMLRR